MTRIAEQIAAWALPIVIGLLAASVAANIAMASYNWVRRDGRIDELTRQVEAISQRVSGLEGK